MSRYATGGQDEFEPGSEGRVLRNKLGIIDPRRAGLVETELLRRSYLRELSQVSSALVLDTTHVRLLHREWLDPIYPFAGELRTVNVSKGGFLFAPIAHLDQGLIELDARFRRSMPCVDLSADVASARIAEIHAELLLLHPFREGNGRISRLVADVMALQAGFGPLRWTIGDEAGRLRYFAALRRGFLTDHEPLGALVREALREPPSADLRG